MVSDFITLMCPSCGGRLEITEDIERFACAHCGTEHIVKRGGGIISLAPVVESLKKVESGVDKTASELTIFRLQREIDDFEKKIDQLTINNPIPVHRPISIAFFVLGLFLLIFGLSLYKYSGFINLVPGLILTTLGVLSIYSKQQQISKRKKDVFDRVKPLEDSIKIKRTELDKNLSRLSKDK